MTDFEYVGSELELFAAVRNWKAYWGRRLRPFLVGDTLEVGAGIGSNTQFLNPEGNGRWVCLEPDPSLVSKLTLSLKEFHAGHGFEVVCGTLRDLGPDQKFDTIVYIDVLEHIEDDREELERAASHLKAGGRIIVLSPAHQRLFTAFDSAIGHFRRYNRPMLRSITPSGMRLEQLWYLDSVGLILSAANRVLLRQSMPTAAQLRFWDTCVIPISRILDRCLFNLVGKSIVAVWRQKSQG